MTEFHHVSERKILKTTKLRRRACRLCLTFILSITASALYAQESSLIAVVDNQRIVDSRPASGSNTTAREASGNSPKLPGPVDALLCENDPRRRFAIVDLNQVDADYHDQGEYVGTVSLNGTNSEIGVQVVALGDGQFEALVYKGGLPGNGFDGTARQKLSGSRSGEQVILKGENLVINLQSGYAAVVKTSGGERLGFLQPVKRLSPTLGAKPPSNATILFNGQNVDQLLDAKITADGLLEVGCETKQLFQNFTLHGEFCVPYMPYARSQDRGNSGFYLQRRYEVQVLDSFGLELQFNDCASLYRYKAPNLNMSFPPLRWQTYDINFTAAKFSVCGDKVCKARITVRHNGVVVQNNVEMENKTGNGKPEGPNPMPILFQNHKNPVVYRNIWIVDHDRACCTQQVCTEPTPSFFHVPCFEKRLRHPCRK